MTDKRLFKSLGGKPGGRRLKVVGSLWAACNLGLLTIGFVTGSPWVVVLIGTMIAVPFAMDIRHERKMLKGKMPYGDEKDDNWRRRNQSENRKDHDF